LESRVYFFPPYQPESPKLCFVEKPEKVLEEASRVLTKDGKQILGLILRESPWARFYMKKAEAGNVFYKNARFYGLSELEAMMSGSKLKIMDTCSTLFQKPTEEPLQPKFQKGDIMRRPDLWLLKLEKRPFDKHFE
jgi:ubiquinone/menaquinone biosynthesis C-methylase UbiE